MRPVTAALLVATVSTFAAAAGAWQVEVMEDPLSLERVEAAAARNADGFTLMVIRDAATGAVRGIFRLPPSGADFLAEEAPQLTVDDRPAHSVKRLDGSLKAVAFPLWSGQGALVSGLLRELVDGDVLLVRYPLAGGVFKETEIDVTDPEGILTGYLGVPAEVSAADVALETARQQAAEACIAVDKKKAQLRCFEALAACEDAGHASAEDFERCIAESP